MGAFKIATWNVNSLKVRLPQVLEWLAAEQPDILALQELKIPTEIFPFDELRRAGYEAVVNGQKTYNGVALLYRNVMPENILIEFSELQDPQRRMIAATFNDVRVVNLYVPNGESVHSEKYQYKLNWLKHLKLFLTNEKKQYSNIILLGDFNIAPQNEDVYDPMACEGKVLFSLPERAEFEALLDLDFKDCFRLRSQPEKSFSWWDYRLNSFKRNLGLRIDHILASAKLAKHCKQCRIDKTPRGWERPTDHAPVVAEFSEYICHLIY
ncbi:MAG TPA: exodeoxyribonuclease III [Gammaproteobacteria bacterium]|nr:exodeoxyribonuclease III [Gammaproteobacteria bacterium]